MFRASKNQMCCRFPWHQRRSRFDVLGKIGRQLFVTALEVIGEPDFPSGIQHQRRFDKVMTQDLPADRCASG